MLEDSPESRMWFPTVDSLILRASRRATAAFAQYSALAERRGPPDYNVSPKKCFALTGSHDIGIALTGSL